MLPVSTTHRAPFPPPGERLVQFSIMVSGQLTARGVVSSTSGATCLVLGYPCFGGNLVSTPAVDSVRQAHDVLAELETYQLAVTGRLEVVWSMVLQWCSCCEASDAGHGTGGQGDCGCGDGVLDLGWRVAAVGDGDHGHRGHRKSGGKSHVDHVVMWCVCGLVSLFSGYCASSCGLWSVASARCWVTLTASVAPWVYTPRREYMQGRDGRLLLGRVR